MKNLIKNGIRCAFELGQKIGMDILPHHFYSQIPDISELRSEIRWKRPRSMNAIEGSLLREQSDILSKWIPEELSKQFVNLDIHQRASDANGQGGGYGPIEAELLHAFILKNQPTKIIQVGCGVSTAIIVRAAQSSGYKPEIVCIEPYPSDYLVRLADEGLITLIREKAQYADDRAVTSLAAGDLLFIDSTHTVKPGSEVNRVILEWLPSLAKGVFVHFHDIYFPYDYQRGILTNELFFSGESVLLQAYLSNNSKYTIMVCQSMLHYENPELLKKCHPVYEPQENDEGLRKGNKGKHFPSAIWLQSLY